MSTVLNDRDAILQAASVRIINPKNASILLNASSSLFHLNAAGAVDVATITVIATLVGLEGDVTFTADGAALTNVTGKSAVVRYADMQGPAAIVTARIVAGGQTFSQSCIIAVVRDGADGGSGARGAGMYFASGSAWSDGTADAVTPGGNVAGDVVTISNGATYSLTKRWSGGEWLTMGAVFDGSLFVTGSINGAALKAGTITIFDTNGKVLLGAGGEFGATVKVSNLQVGGPSDNLVPDVRFNDTAWWGREGWPISDYPANGFWKQGRSLVISPARDGVERDSFSKWMPVVPGASYLVEFQTFISNDFQGSMGAYLHIPRVAYDLMGAPDTGYKFPDGLPISFGSVSIKGGALHRAVVTIPTTVNNEYIPNQVQIRIRGGCSAGYMEMGSFSIVRRMDGLLIDDGVLSARHIVGDTLDVLAAKLGSIEIGPGGNLRQGMTDFYAGTGIWMGMHQGVPKFSIGTPGQSCLYWNGSEMIAESLRQISQFSASMAGASLNGLSNTAAYVDYAVLSPALSNGVAPYQYAWSFSKEDGGDIVMFGDPGASSVTIRGRGTNIANVGWASVTITDAKGLITRARARVTARHGAA